MNDTNKSLLKKIILIVIGLSFLATLPAIWQNGNRSEQAEDEVRQLLRMAKQICDTGCTDYPADWVIEGKETEAETYCKAQCTNNMEGIRKGLLNEGFPVLFTNNYNYRVAQAYCLLGLSCPQMKVTDVITNYNP